MGYTKKWPHCSNIKCADKTPITKMATECAKNKLCSGFSFSTGVSTGHGCLKKCGAKETGGYGSGGYDYWVKKPAAKPKYSYAGTGKNSCASVKKKPITTEAGCKAAAKALKKTYVGKGSYSTWQKACFMTNNRFYFNVHKAGKTHKSGNPVCAGPAKTAPKYSMAGNGKSNCGKQKPVSPEAACKAAGKILKKAWGGSGSYATWPKACFLYNNKLYFNKHKTGKANKQGNPVCAGASGGKKTTKKQQKAKTVVAYQTPDTRSGCPRSQGANSALITRRVTVKEDSYVVATGHMIRLYQGRADL